MGLQEPSAVTQPAGAVAGVDDLVVSGVEGLLGGKSYLPAEVKVVGLMAVYVGRVAVEHAGIYLDGQVETDDFLPFGLRVGRVERGTAGGTQRTDTLGNGVEGFLALAAFHHPHSQVKLWQQVGGAEILAAKALLA